MSNETIVIRMVDLAPHATAPGDTTKCAACGHGQSRHWSGFEVDGTSASGCGKRCQCKRFKR